ncbi:MAG: hypothetical protein ACYCYM_02200 [Saccharofermentanales bacterium]
MKTLSKKQWILSISAIVILSISGFFVWNAISAPDGDLSDGGSSSVVSRLQSDESSGGSSDSSSSSSSQISLISDELSADSSIPDAQIDLALKSLIAPAAVPITLDQEKATFDKIDFSARLFRPVFDTKVDLYIASAAAKPSAMPGTGIVGKRPDITAASVYADRGFIDSTASAVRWFAFNKDPAITPAKYVWQVGIAPFPGNEDAPLAAAGLISSGDVSAGSKEFSIDFNTIVSKKSITFSGSRISKSGGISFIFPLANLNMGTPGVQKTYYVRLLPVDMNGKVIGDGGRGMPVRYGRPVAKARTGILFQLRFPLLSPKDAGDPTFTGEFRNSFVEEYTQYISSTGAKNYYFLPQEMPAKTVTCILQIAKAPMPSKDWETSSGLVYEKRLHKGTAAFDNLATTNSIKVDFSGFAPPDSQLTPDERIRYYVRVVALVPGTETGTFTPFFSKEITVIYGRPADSNFKFYETVLLDAQMPTVVSYSYTPIKWEEANWQYRFEVFRQPAMNEIFPGFGSDDLYAPFKVGTKLDFTPHYEEKSWWEEAVEAISDFFSDLTGFLADIVNWVSETYADLKSGIIKFVAEKLTYLTPSLRGLVEDALTGLVDYGLASIGIPPSLPNFDELADMGVDYLATMALETAGVPAADYAKEGLTDIAGGLSSGLSSSTQSASPNPFNWKFIKPDPDALFRPAYLLIELRNDTGVESAPGYINGYNEFIIDTGNGILAGTEQQLYAAYGGNVYYRTFKVVSGQKIPSLAPGQTIVIPVFLEEIIGDSFWSGGPKVDKGYFKMMYYNLGKYDFSFSLMYDLPSAAERAKELNLPDGKIYKYKSTGTSISFTTEPFVGVSGK